MDNTNVISQNVQVWLQNKLDNMQIEDDFDLLSYCAYAGRLASLGMDKYIKHADEMLVNGPFRQEIDQFFTERIEQGIWDIQEQLDQELAVSITELQDFYCFFKHTEYPFASNLRDYFNEWVQYGENAVINTDAAELLVIFLEANPLPEEDLLAIVANPMPEIMRHISDRVFQRDNKAYSAIPQDGGWTLTDNYYRMRLVLCKESANIRQQDFDLYSEDASTGEKIPADGFFVRQGLLSAKQNPENPVRWTIDYQLLEGVDLNAVRRQPLEIRFPYGGRSRVELFPAASQPLRNAYGCVTLIPKAAFVLAAAEEEAERVFQFNVEGVQAFLDITVSFAENAVLVNVFAPDDDENAANELDGWALFDSDGTELGVIEKNFVRFDINLFNGELKLQAPDGSVRLLTEKKDID